MAAANVLAWKYGSAFVGTSVSLASFFATAACLISGNGNSFNNPDPPACETPAEQVGFGTFIGSVLLVPFLAVSYGLHWVSPHTDSAIKEQLTQTLNASTWTFDPATKSWGSTKPLIAEKDGKTYECRIVDVRNVSSSSFSATQEAPFHHYAQAKCQLPVSGFLTGEPTEKTATVEISSDHRPGQYKIGPPPSNNP